METIQTGIVIIGAGYNSSNSTSGVTNGSSQVYANSGNGKAKITLLSVRKESVN